MTYVIGLMAGTSMDGVDAALVQFDAEGKPQLQGHHTVALPAPLLIELHKLCRPGSDEINRLGRADRALAQVFAEACHNLLAKTDLQASDISAIGSHGQTIRHMPEGHHAFTLQLGCPNTLATLTNIDVVADFRRKDIALGGQGAPLVPAFHQALFQGGIDRAIVNIGGISNITWLPADNSEVLGYDTGPGNTLMDAWCREHLGCSYDDGGAIAASGHVNDDLLKRLLSHPYFSQPAPKSTGRELFNLVWLQGHLHSLAAMPDKDVLATLLAATVISISDCISHHSSHAEVYLCGGGAFNNELLRQLKQRLPHSNVRTTEVLGLAPQWVESTAFAWLAYRHINGLSGNLPAVTGASRKAILGGLYPAG